MNNKKLKNFLLTLGFSNEEINNNLNHNIFTYNKIIKFEKYSHNSLAIKYIFIPSINLKKELYEIHVNIWNENTSIAFIVVSDNNCYIINAKAKPIENNPLYKNAIIKSFNYGINSTGFEPEKLKEIYRQQIDSGYFLNFIIKQIKKRKITEVDKDLLLNLIALKDDLLKSYDDDYTVHLLILRCLFMKYLEDRKIYDNSYLAQILNSGSANKLIAAFREIEKINGDIFKYDKFKDDDIKPEYLSNLATFFSCWDYNSGQGKFFPYRFDKIPIQLISHVYEAFLKSDQKRNKGIYYTPTFIVDFMLSHTVTPALTQKRNLTVLDPACGSGAFLVKAFQKIIEINKATNDYDAKVKILTNQVFGIDIDKQALQIATFSLYLALLENEDPIDIRNKIKNAYPILPKLINKTLIRGNSLLDNTFNNLTFDCIVTNPPWGSVPKDGDDEDQKERKAIGGKGKSGSMPEYKNVSDYQRSQAFLLRVDKWCRDNTRCCFIVNNPIFLNEHAENFRLELLQKYRITYFYELSNFNKILFKKRVIGKIKNKEVEVGSSEPCAVLVFDKKNYVNNVIKYISPRLNDFSEHLNLIYITQKDIKEVKQVDFPKDDLLWRVLVNGSWVDYQLIKQKYFERDKVEIECRSGFQPKKDMRSKGEPDERELIKPSDFRQYFIKERLDTFNWNQGFRRKPNIFTGKRILIPVKPLKSDKLRIRGVRVDKNLIHKHNILCIRIKKNGSLINNYAPYLAILNSSFIGYYSYQTATLWGKDGDAKRVTLRNDDVEKLPFPKIDNSDKRIIKLTQLVDQIESGKNENKDTQQFEQQINELVFDLYELLDYEKEIVREFYLINVERKGEFVKQQDLQDYLARFRKVFSFILNEQRYLNAAYRISNNIGAFICFTIVNKENGVEEIKQSTIEDSKILDIVKRQQLEDVFFTNRLNEDKIKIYEEDRFFIIKSNYLKDWTVRQAMNDANEEIGLVLKEMPKE